MPKNGISDPQGLTIERALPSRGFGGIEHVRVGKHIEFLLEATDAGTAEQQVRAACEQFLSNPVIEDFDFRISPRTQRTGATEPEVMKGVAN